MPSQKQNFSSTTPAAPAGYINVTWQADAPSAVSTIRNISGYIPAAGTGTITEVVAGTGLTGGGVSGSVTVSLSTPIAVADGGTGTATPGLVAGTGISVTGSWPDQTINYTGAGATLDFSQTFMLMGA